MHDNYLTVIITGIAGALPVIALILYLQRLTKNEKRFNRMVYSFAKFPGYSLNKKIESESEYLLILILLLSIFPNLIIKSLQNFNLPLAVIVVFVVCIIPFLIATKKFKAYLRYKKGFRAELMVGMKLEEDLDSRFTIIHDFQLGDEYNHGSNIDHLVIAPTGIFIIETKYKSCPKGEDPKLLFDRETITDPTGYQSDQHIKQLKGIIDQFRSYCKREFGLDNLPIKIEGFLVYAGWHIDFTEAKSKNSDKYNIRVSQPKGVIKAMKTVAQQQRHWDNQQLQDEFIRHLKKKNEVKVK